MIWRRSIRASFRDAPSPARVSFLRRGRLVNRSVHQYRRGGTARHLVGLGACRAQIAGLRQAIQQKMKVNKPRVVVPACENTPDRLVIERMEVIDELAARVVRDQAAQKRAPAETVRKAIEIGTRVIESEGTAANIDFVNAKFQEHMSRLATELSSQLESGSEELAERISTAFGADRSDSVQQQIREMLIKANEHQRTELVRLFNAEEGTNTWVPACRRSF